MTRTGFTAPEGEYSSLLALNCSTQPVPAPSAPPATTSSAVPPPPPPLLIPIQPGLPANADVSQTLVGPPTYNSKLETISIHFPLLPPPNPFPHPGFLSATKYSNKKINGPDIDEELIDASSSSTDDQSHKIHSKKSVSSGITNNRPRAAFKGSTSTFIKSSEGLPIPQSTIKTFYTETAGEDGGEERTFGLYTWNKSLFFVQLSPPTNTSQIFRINFASYPSAIRINKQTISASSIEIIVGFTSGDILYFDPFCGRYTRLNKGGIVSTSTVTNLEWLKGSNQFVSSHRDGSLMYWDKERDDWNLSTPFVFNSATSDRIIQPTPKPNPNPTTTTTTIDIDIDPRSDDIIISDGLGPSSNTIHADTHHKRARFNPISHWKIATKSVSDFAFSPDSKFCAIVSEDGTLRIIDTQAEKLIDTYSSYFGALLSVCWSHDGRFVFTGGQDDLVTIYSPIEQRVIARCQGHSSFVTKIGFDPWVSDEKSCRFGSVSDDCKLIFWDLSGACLAKPRLQQINSHNSRRQSLVSNHSISPVHQYSLPENHLKEQRGRQQQQTDPPVVVDSNKSRDFHTAPGRNEVAILQPVMVKEIGIDPLSSISYHRGMVVVGSRTGQISVFGRPTPTTLVNPVSLSTTIAPPLSSSSDDSSSVNLTH
ncbi:hypothetical protein MJO28_010671 [Puccinia striiformis f. sp. tritici]|uniref:Uncharacterized protein n=1 Tax=Puccinia striiformis f. sp. tritici TaxID=168172 RepID=A0ACC0E6K2_9BASI|nr:hypothetical protein MJO28_010671 [Puccinia striiformis f. sp. tritici]